MHHLIILVLSEPFEADLATSEWPQISKNYLDIQTQPKKDLKLRIARCYPDSMCSRICLCPCCLTRCSFLHFIAAQFREDLRWWRWCWDLQLAATLPPSPQQLKPSTILSAVAALKTLDSWPLPVFTAALQHCSLHHEANCEVYFCWWAAFRVFRQPGTRPLHKIYYKEST